MLQVLISRIDDYVLASPKAVMTDSDFIKLKNLIVQKIAKEEVNGVLLDLNILTVLDSYATRMLYEIGQSTLKEGIQTVIFGIKTDISHTMKKEGLTFTGIKKADNLEDGLNILKSVNKN